jgi:hypothetical protein
MWDRHPWAGVDELLEELRSSAVEADALPESMALIFHGGRFSAVLRTPPFVLEDADVVTDELCRFLPSVGADGIAVVWPARYEDDDGTVLIAMKVLLWERARPAAATTRIVPLAVAGSPDGPSVDLPPPDPWSRRLAAALGSPPEIPGILDARFRPGFELFVAPSGPLAAAVPLQLEN